MEYNGISNHKKLLDSNANFEEFDVSTPDKKLRIKAQTLRMYNPESHQWSMNISSSATGVLSPPAVGGFAGGHGEFLDQEEYNGRSILVRFEVSVLTPASCRFEQSFSADGGKTWELNLVVNETLVRD